MGIQDFCLKIFLKNKIEIYPVMKIVCSFFLRGGGGGGVCVTQIFIKCVLSRNVQKSSKSCQHAHKTETPLNPL